MKYYVLRTTATAVRRASKAHSMHVFLLAGECVPLRVFLKPYSLTPTYRATNKFTVKYFLNLVLVDEEDRRSGKVAFVFSLKFWRVQISFHTLHPCTCTILYTRSLDENSLSLISICTHSSKEVEIAAAGMSLFPIA